MAFEMDLTAYAKGAMFGGDSALVYIDIYGENLSAAAFKWVFYNPADRVTKITLNAAGSGSEGIYASYSATDLHPESGAVVGRTRLLVQINEATLEALTFSGVDDLLLAHTLYCTPSAMGQFVLAVGSFTIRQGGAD